MDIFHKTRRRHVTYRKRGLSRRYTTMRLKWNSNLFEPQNKKTKASLKIRDAFIWSGLRGSTLARTVRSVIRGENSSTGRVFYTAPTSRPEPKIKKQPRDELGVAFYGADYGARTRHLHLGKVALYQMS